ncbi:uncharacterized protein [Apostichopus japonicus]|uniref:uncharacterized protein n=1 Tax=Stichopus japonicus TaxID=307972 RepID=UPI003AB35838
MGLYFGTLLFLLNIQVIPASQVHLIDVDSQQWGVKPCTAVNRLEVICPWSLPKPIPPNTSCELYFRLPENHSQRTERKCRDLEVWTRCPEPFQSGDSKRGCRFPNTSDAFVRCGPIVETRINCSDGRVSKVRKVNQSELRIPKPVIGLKAVALGSSEIKLHWTPPDTERKGYVVQYQQEYSPTVYTVAYENVNTAIITNNLHYANANTTIKVAAYYLHNRPDKLSNWSRVYVTTKMAAPAEGPRNLIVKYTVDCKKMKRSVNLTWDAIPDQFSGGPIENYTVKWYSDNGAINEPIITPVTTCLLDLHPTHGYTISVCAKNVIGYSIPAEYQLKPLICDTNKGMYYSGIGVTCLAVILMLMLGISVLRKQMKTSQLPVIKLHVKTVTMNNKSRKTEKEVFDSLKFRSDLISTEMTSETIRPKVPVSLKNVFRSFHDMPIARDVHLLDSENIWHDVNTTIEFGLEDSYEHTDRPDQQSRLITTVIKPEALISADDSSTTNEGPSEADYDRNHEYQLNESYSEELVTANTDGKVAITDQCNEKLDYTLVSTTSTDGYVQQALAF